MTEREKMLSGALYNAGDKELAEAHMRARRLCRQYNELPPDEEEARDLKWHIPLQLATMSGSAGIQ